MDRLISLQAAIDAARDRMGKGETNIGDTFIECFEMILNALPSAQPDNQIHLCDSCEYNYPDCPCKPNDVIFGNGKGNDNICACNKYNPSAQPDKDALDDAYAHGYTAAESEFRKRMEKPEPQWIPVFKAKDEDSDLWVTGFYFAYPETTYCFTEDYERHPVKIVHCITFHMMTDWCLPNRPTVCNIDIDTLELVGWVDSKRKMFGNEPWILPEPYREEK